MFRASELRVKGLRLDYLMFRVLDPKYHCQYTVIGVLGPSRETIHPKL